MPSHLTRRGAGLDPVPHLLQRSRQITAIGSEGIGIERRRRQPISAGDRGGREHVQRQPIHHRQVRTPLGIVGRIHRVQVVRFPEIIIGIPGAIESARVDGPAKPTSRTRFAGNLGKSLVTACHMAGLVPTDWLAMEVPAKAILRSTIVLMFILPGSRNRETRLNGAWNG